MRERHTSGSVRGRRETGVSTRSIPVHFDQKSPDFHFCVTDGLSRNRCFGSHRPEVASRALCIIRPGQIQFSISLESTASYNLA